MKINELRVGKLIEEARQIHARPGGGAVSILTANLAVNLSLMMNKNNWGDLENEAEEFYKEMLHISDLLTKCADEDVYYANVLVDQFKKKGQVDEKYFIDAARPQVRLNTLALKAMEIMAFFLKHGKKLTLVDGEIANELIYGAIKASVPTLEMNLKDTNYKYDINQVLKDAEKLYYNNRNIIERRKA